MDDDDDPDDQDNIDILDNDISNEMAIEQAITMMQCNEQNAIHTVHRQRENELMGLYWKIKGLEKSGVHFDYKEELADVAARVRKLSPSKLSRDYSVNSTLLTNNLKPNSFADIINMFW